MNHKLVRNALELERKVQEDHKCSKDVTSFFDILV